MIFVRMGAAGRTRGLGCCAVAGSGLAVVLLALPLEVSAVVSQPTGEMMPNPTLMAEFDVVTSRGFATDTVTLDGLFKYRMEMLNPVQDARSVPGTFSPKCDFTGQLMVRGGSCQVAFGWYNVTEGSMTPPPANEIYELVPAQIPRCPMTIDPMLACCDDNDFCPLADMTTTQAPQHRWNAPVFRASNIRMDPRYKGGLIGFAMIGNPNLRCSQTKFSQAELNTKSAPGAPTNGAPWITVLVYQSTRDPNGYYIAFEDLPVTTASWKGNGNDGDFNDFVYYVTGVNCGGGGKACNTNMPGVCAAGTTLCTAGTSVMCKPDTPPSAEICDGLDNDCDGVVDQGNPCPGLNDICDRGVCVQRCNDTEFPCRPGLQCDQGYCKDPQCLGVTCGAEQVCVGGTCMGGCDGVVCPQGQRCRLGRCIDPCAGVTCTEGMCENGVCLPACSCRGCEDGLACKADGRCVDPGCDKMDCGAGLVCTRGSCVDPCVGGTRCPSGQACSMGKCMDLPKTGTGGVVGIRLDAGATGLGGFVGIPGGGGGSGGNRGDAGPNGGGATTGDGVKRCGCDLGGSSAGLFSVLSILAATGVAGRRRGRRD